MLRVSENWFHSNAHSLSTDRNTLNVMKKSSTKESVGDTGYGLFASEEEVELGKL